MSGDEIETAPDGSTVRRLARVTGGSMAQFTFAAESVSRAVRHRSVEELWFVLEGCGSLWRAPGSSPAVVVDLQPGVSVSIEAGSAFQVRVQGTGPLRVLAVTMPPWPGDAEAELVPGYWD